MLPSAAWILRRKWDRHIGHMARSQGLCSRGGWTGRVRWALTGARTPRARGRMRARLGHRRTESLQHLRLQAWPVISPLGLASVSTLTKTLPEGSVISQCLVGGGL